MAEDEGFLQRWARLKAERSKPPLEKEERRPAPAGPPAAAAEGGEVPAIDDLPPIEELTAESDFTPFLRAGVPEELKRLALRKLWRSDPVFANLDGLVEYGEDFGAAFKNPGPVATLFRIGRGMPGPEDLPEEPAEESADPAAIEASETPAVQQKDIAQVPASGPAPQAASRDSAEGRNDSSDPSNSAG